MVHEPIASETAWKVLGRKVKAGQSPSVRLNGDKVYSLSQTIPSHLADLPAVDMVIQIGTSAYRFIRDGIRILAIGQAGGQYNIIPDPNQPGYYMARYINSDGKTTNKQGNAFLNYRISINNDGLVGLS